MKPTPLHYALVLYEVTAGVSRAELDDRLNSFIALLARERAAALLPRIVESFEEIVASHAGKTRARVEVTAPLSDGARKRLAHAWETSPDALAITETKNPELLSGLRFQSNDRVISISLRDRLNRLTDALYG